MNPRCVPMMALAVAVLFAPALVIANTINYGDKVGITTAYTNINETSMSSGDSAPLYGSPTLSGDSLVFMGMTFNSQAANGATDITDGKLDTDIIPKGDPDRYIDRIRIQEYGDTTLTGPTGTSATHSSAANSVFITVLALDSGDLVFPEFISVNVPMSDNGYWALQPECTGELWNGSLTVDLTAILESRGYSGHATWVHLTTDNTLATASELNTSAYIAKKAEGLSVTALIVPEPSTLSLLALGGAFLVVRRFRRKA